MLNRNLLVVDADPAVHRAVKDSLGGKARIMSAFDAHAAMECLTRVSCDVVLAPYNWAAGAGGKLAAAIESAQPGARLILTGDGGAAEAVAALHAGSYAYFHKPLPEAPLADMVQLAFESTLWRDDIRLISAKPAWLECDVRCKLDAAERVVCFVREIESDLAGKACEDVTGAFRELLFNAVEHGGGANSHKKARIALVRTARSVTGFIRDPGEGFSIGMLPHAAIGNPEGSPTRHVEIRAEQGQRPGGFGIMMARNLVDELVYDERGSGVMFVKYLA